MADLRGAAASGLLPVASQASGLQTGSCLLVLDASGVLHGFRPQSLPLSFVIQLLLAVLSPPCPDQDLSLPLPATHLGGIKSREVNDGRGRV